MVITFEKLIQDSKDLAELIPPNKYEYVYGIPSGGILPAYILAEKLNCKLISQKELPQYMQHKTLIVDDLIDSGKTLEKYSNYDTVVLYKKPHSPKPTYWYEDIPNEWIYLSYEKEETGIEDHIIRVKEFINQDKIPLEIKGKLEDLWTEILKKVVKPNNIHFLNHEN